MLRHVVMFRWVDDITAAQVEEFAAGLAAIPAAVPTIRQYHFGPDAGVSADSWDYVVVADFDDDDGYLVYRDHPAHRSLRDLIQPIVSQRAAVQYRY